MLLPVLSRGGRVVYGLRSWDEGPFAEVEGRGEVVSDRDVGLRRRALSWSCWRTWSVKRAWRADRRYKKAVSPSWRTPYEARVRWLVHKHWPITQRCTRGWKPYSRNIWGKKLKETNRREPWWNKENIWLDICSIREKREEEHGQTDLLFQSCGRHMWENFHSNTTGWGEVFNYNSQTEIKI